MPTPIDNPAGRLHAVFTRLVDHADAQSIDQAWARTLGCKEGNTRCLGERLTEITSLLNDCRVAANSLRATADVDSLLWHFPAWSKAVFAFGVNRSAGVSPRKILGPDSIASLGALATILHLNAPELSFKSSIDSSELEACRQQLDELTELVFNEPLIPGPIRSNILRMLGEVADSFDFIAYRGAERLARSVSSATQYITLQEDTRALASKPVLERLDDFADKARSIGEKIWSMLAPPTGIVYILTTGDVMGGGMIMAANPNVAKSIGTLGSAISAAASQRQIGPSEKSG